MGTDAGWWAFLFECFYLLSEHGRNQLGVRVGWRCWRLEEREGKEKLSRREGE